MKRIRTGDTAYSQVVILDPGEIPVYLSGMVAPGVDDTVAQAHEIFDKVDALLAEAGTDNHHLVRVTIYLTRKDDFAAVSQKYREWIGQDDALPARVSLVLELPVEGATVEMDFIAVIEPKTN